MKIIMVCSAHSDRMGDWAWGTWAGTEKEKVRETVEQRPSPTQ